MYSFAITFFERVNFKYIIMDKKRVYTFGNGQAEGKACLLYTSPSPRD